VGDLLAVRGLGDLEVEEIEDVLAAGDGTPRQASGENLGEGRQIGPDAVFGLGTARRHAEAGHHLVEDQQHAVLPGQFAQRLQKRRVDRQLRAVRAGRLDARPIWRQRKPAFLSPSSM
jgi:hypothetical protein